MVPRLKKVFQVLLVISLGLIIIGTIIQRKFISQQWIEEEEVYVDPPICTLPKLDPFDSSIINYVNVTPPGPCIFQPKLTYMKGSWLLVNASVLANVYDNNVSSCAYQRIMRQGDNAVNYGKTTVFDLRTPIRIAAEFVRVSCYCHGVIERNLCYRNYHLTFVERNEVHESQQRNSRTNGRRWNVMVLGTDGVSRSSSVRMLPKTRQFLIKQLGAIEMLGYTKVGLNTFPNMVPFLTGIPGNALLTWRRWTDYVDLVVRKYKQRGYATLWGEDRPDVALFNSYHSGFWYPPTDYYFRPIALAMHEDRKNLSQTYTGCEEKMAMTKLNLEYLENFVLNYKQFFSYTFNTELSHDVPQDGRQLDVIYLNFLKKFKEIGIWENTILIFASDHGQRWGDILNTQVGRIEGRLPFLLFALPELFQKEYPEFVNNMQQNSDKLTTAYDIHRTMLDILDIEKAGVNRPGSVDQSLFSEIAESRTCRSAHIPLQFCTCLQEQAMSTSDPVVQQTALFLVKEINDVLANTGGLCAKLTLFNVTSSIRLIGTGDVKSNSSTNLQVSFVTLPGFGMFEGTVTASIDPLNYKEQDLPTLRMQGPISRLNRYGNQSACVPQHEPLHRLYCYCNSNIRTL